MRAISLWQPWGSLWASGRKVHETRHFPTDYRGPLAIHAAQHFEREVGTDLDALLIDAFGQRWSRELPAGAIVGTCRLIACHKIIITNGLTQAKDEDDFISGDWRPGRYAWEGAEFVLFKRPIEWKGRQGFFTVPDSVLAQAEAA